MMPLNANLSWVLMLTLITATSPLRIQAQLAQHQAAPSCERLLSGAQTLTPAVKAYLVLLEKWLQTVKDPTLLTSLSTRVLSEPEAIQPVAHAVESRDLIFQSGFAKILPAIAKKDWTQLQPLILELLATHKEQLLVTTEKKAQTAYFNEVDIRSGFSLPGLKTTEVSWQVLGSKTIIAYIDNKRDFVISELSPENQLIEKHRVRKRSVITNLRAENVAGRLFFSFELDDYPKIQYLFALDDQNNLQQLAIGSVSLYRDASDWITIGNSLYIAYTSRRGFLTVVEYTGVTDSKLHKKRSTKIQIDASRLPTWRIINGQVFLATISGQTSREISLFKLSEQKKWWFQTNLALEFVNSFTFPKEIASSPVWHGTETKPFLSVILVGHSINTLSIGPNGELEMHNAYQVPFEPRELIFGILSARYVPAPAWYTNDGSAHLLAPYEVKYLTMIDIDQVGFVARMDKLPSEYLKIFKASFAHERTVLVLIDMWGNISIKEKVLDEEFKTIHESRIRKSLHNARLVSRGKPQDQNWLLVKDQEVLLEIKLGKTRLKSNSP